MWARGAKDLVVGGCQWLPVNKAPRDCAPQTTTMPPLSFVSAKFFSKRAALCIRNGYALAQEFTVGDHKETAYWKPLTGLLPARLAIASIAAATATATATAITGVTAAVAAESSAATAAAIFPRLGFVDFQGTTADFFAI